MFAVGLIIVYAFELLMLYVLICIFDLMLAEYYKEPIARWNKLSKLIE